MSDVKYHVAVVDDDLEMRESLEHFLGKAGFETSIYPSANALLSDLIEPSPHTPDVVVSDVRMPGIDGLQLLDEIKARLPLLPVVIVSAHGDVPMAVSAMQQGAYNFLEKPFDPSRLVTIIRHGAETHRLGLENNRLRQRITQLSGLDHHFIGETETIRQLKKDIVDLAPTDAAIMVQGETGTGKEIVARSLHELSHRGHSPFIAVNCAAIPENHFEISMFGSIEGAFGDHVKEAKGYFASANGGTLFLDEVGACPIDQQAKLLRVLETKEVTPVGSTTPVKLDIRIISATNENLNEAVVKGQFREDLLYRLNTLIMELPPLRQMGDDIILLFTHYLTEYATRYGVGVPQLAPDDLGALYSYEWPGNVRELKQIAERFILSVKRGQASLRRAMSFDSAQPSEPESLKDALNAYERRLIIQALKLNNGTMETVATQLGIGRRTLNEKLVKFDINRKDYT